MRVSTLQSRIEFTPGGPTGPAESPGGLEAADERDSPSASRRHERASYEGARISLSGDDDAHMHGRIVQR